MARLTYSAICSLDGYTVDEHGDFGWCAPDEEVHAAVNDVERPIGTYLYGRRMYDVLRVWETLDLTDASPATRDFAELWRAADKVVFSRTLEEPTTSRTRIERELDLDAVRGLADGARLDLELVDQRRFDSGFVQLGYRARR
ncbi:MULTISPECIES: dihydrofolate reductase family protein [unclassified Nocardioides]|uniref:dihydrofolate reductase family protein n=1 Tax=unclassified Nocardioides TaxID=2615069 RepID=UPI0009F10A23|nr:MULTISPECIES: dihydrofolate reductase family protein [unclassified Nocardioides]GAW51501.1 Riboflavin biosynthesis protein ribD [Nocardioides sp. PD653-B2]GAW56124.1 Riboflavin biosynthesis protein ribD [Nocardioides sp. PD653]